MPLRWAGRVVSDARSSDKRYGRARSLNGAALHGTPLHWQSGFNGVAAGNGDQPGFAPDGLGMWEQAPQPCTTDQRPILTVLAPSNQGHNKASDQQWSEAPQMRLTIDADAEIQVDVLGHEAVLKVLGEARIGRGVRAFRRSPAEQGLGVR